MSQEAAIAFLSDPRSFGADVSQVERHETHASIVFLAGDLAYKLKRAVKYPYMDYSTLARRRVMCEAELRVNRRTAPELYLDVRAIVRKDGEVCFGAPDQGFELVDWVVVMRRFNQADLLEEMRKRGDLRDSLVRDLADVVAAFHASAERHADYGGAQGILRVIDENAKVLAMQQMFERQNIDDLMAKTRVEYEIRAALLDARRSAGRVRRCHGDLHLNNICVIEGRPVLFDAIEFSDDFSCIDTFYDIAFLVMDLDRRNLRRSANVLLNRYLEQTLDYEGVSALPLFLSCRAAVRAHVTATLSQKMCGERAFVLREDALSLLRKAHSYLDAAVPRLVAIGGASGTGKTTIARAIAPVLGRPPGGVVLRSDVIRKALCGVGEMQQLPEAAYSAEMTARVYETLSNRARTLLSAGQSVVADAVYGQPWERQQIEHVASEAEASFAGLWLEAPSAILERRIEGREVDASDATVGILRKQLGWITAPDNWEKVDVAGSQSESISRALKAMDP